MSRTPDNTPTQPLTDALVDAWRSGTPLSAAQAHALAPADDASAYRIQRQTGAALGWFADGRPRAWKMGGDSRTSRWTSSPIADGAILRTGSEPFPFAASRVHTLIGVEFELAVQLAHALPAEADAQAVRAAIGTVFAAIEICDIRATGANLPATFYLADLQNNHCLILGEQRDGGWRDSDGDGEVTLTRNGAEYQRQRGGHPMGDPLYLLPWLNRHAQQYYGSPLQAGDIVTTGTWTGLYPARAGDRLSACYADVGRIAIDIL